jgi:hypothetical protein
MSQGTTFTGRVYLGTNQTTSLSLRAVAGVPAFVLGDNAGDQVLSDNGQIYVCDGAAWSPLVNANGGTNMTSALVVGLPSPGPALSASATGSNISTSTATDAYAVTDTTGAGVVARIDTGSGAARITAEDSGATPIPLNLAIDALQVNGAAGTSGQVLTSAGPSGAPTWTSPAAGIDQLTGDVTAGPGSGSQVSTVVGMGGTATKTLYVIEGGQYATLQAAVNAATANTMILVGPKTTGDWGDVVLNVVDKPLIIAAISGAGSNKIVKTGAITYDLGTSGPALNVSLNETYLYGLYIQGSFAGSAVTLTGGANYPGRLRLYGCYVLNSNAAGAAAVTNSNAGANSSLYLDGTVVSLSNSTTGSAIVQTAGYTVIRNRCEISGSLAALATGFAINASAGVVEIFDSSISIGVARAFPTINITGATTYVSAGYSTLANGSDASGAACVNIGTSGATFGAGDATLAAGTTPGTAAVAIKGVAGGNFLYTNISFGYTATVSTVTATAFPQSGGLFSFGLSVGSLLAQTFTVSSTGNITKLNNVTTSFPSAQGADTQVLTNNGAGTLSWTNGNRYTLGSIGAAPTAANMRTNATYTVAVAAVALPAMAAGDDGLTVSLLNISGAPSTVTPSTGVARQMTAGGGQTWVWRNTGTSWFCTSNV